MITLLFASALAATPSCSGSFSECLRELQESGVAHSEAEALVMLESQCKEDGNFCELLAQRYWAAEKPDLMLGVRLIEQGCEAGNQKSCVILGQVLYEGAVSVGHGIFFYGAKVSNGSVVVLQDDKLKDPERGYALVQEACGSGYQYGCYTLAGFYLKQKNYAAAATLYEQVCIDKYAMACLNAAQLYQGYSSIKDLPRARMYYQLGCEQGIGYACSALGNMFMDGSGGRVDMNAALERFRQACARQHKKSCVEAAQLLKSGDVGAVDWGGAVLLYEQACELGDAGSCRVLSKLYQKGKHVEVDMTLSSEYFDKACKLEPGSGCL